MAHCAHSSCGRWRPDALTWLGRLGVYFDDKWFCSTKCVEAQARHTISEARHYDEWVTSTAISMPLGRLLVQRQVVTADTVAAALRAQRDSGRRLGDELLAMRATTPREILRALAAQAGVGCVQSIDVARVASAPGDLQPETVRVLRVVPFDANSSRHQLSVACASPLPGGALAAVREMTGWYVQPFLVADDLLDRLIAAYGSDQPGKPPVRPVRTVPDAAATIAQAAHRRVARRMHQVRCDDFVWVRLEGETEAEDFMVKLDQLPKEQTWQAVPTPH